MTGSMRGAWRDTSAGRIHYRTAEPPDGRGCPLVLVHGLGVSSAYFARLQPRLATTRAVYAIDLPGCGQSARDSVGRSVAEFAAALEAFLVASGLGQVELFGHSLGGQIVAQLALVRPDLVARVILAAPTLGWRGRGALVLCGNLLRDGIREPLSLYPRIVPAYLRCGPRRMARTDALAARHDLAATVRRLSQPLLVLRGARDCLFSAEDLATLREAAPRLTAAVVPGAAHAVHWSHPREVAATVDAFLAAPVVAPELAGRDAAPN